MVASMKAEEEEAKAVWNNGDIPVILRRGGSQAVRLRIPYASSNRNWLKNGSRKKDPEWVTTGKYWELPASRFNDLVKMLLSRFGKLYIIQPYREREVCATKCMNAHGFDCQCSCMGANHGSANSDGWFEVSESFAVRYGEKRLACRLIKSIKDL